MESTSIKVIEGYERVSPFFDNQKWFDFWRKNEGPIILEWLKKNSIKKLLDAGCGTCPYYPLAKNYVEHYYGIDPSEGMLSKAKEKFYKESPNGLNLKQADLIHIPYEDNYFDGILSTRVLSHIDLVEIGFSELSRVLRPQKQCLITDVHPEHNYENTGFQTPHGKISINTFKHSLENICSAAKQNGLNVVELKEFDFNSLSYKPKQKLRKLRKFPENKIFYLLILEKTK